MKKTFLLTETKKTIKHSQKIKRYLNQNETWEEEDEKFDEELKHKHNNLIAEDLDTLNNRTGDSIMEPLKRMNSKSNNRESFDIDIKLLIQGKFTLLIFLILEKTKTDKIHKIVQISDDDSPTDSPTDSIYPQQQENFEISDWSDLVWIDQSIEDKNKSLQKSKSKLDKFKEMVDRSASKHMSCLYHDEDLRSNDSFNDNICSIKVSSVFNYLPDNAIRQKKDNSKDINEALNTIKKKVNIEADDDENWLLLPKIKVPNNFGIKAAVYDYIYMTEKLPEPTLESFPGAFLNW